MADTSAKKRKRADDGKTKPKKKSASELEVPTTPIRISSVSKADYCPPVIASTAGTRADQTVTFDPYHKKHKSTGKKSQRAPAASQDLLLHSTKHRTLDFTVREEENFEDGSHTQQHFVGIFDPKTGNLEVVEAKRMVLRGSVRAKQADEEALIPPSESMRRQEQKTDLGQTFGTRKARKVIESNALNALTPNRPAGEDPSSPAKLDDAEKATLSTIGQVTSNMATSDQLQAAIDSSKPVPRANLEAEEIADVYDPNVFIGADVLKAVPVRDWQESLANGEDVKLVSRYVARRIQRVSHQEHPTEKLRLLRYLYFLILFFIIAKEGKRGTRRVPQKDQLAKNLSPAPSSVIENIRRKFSDGGEMRKFHIDLLMTHCCALSAIIDNFETETKDLREDLRVDQKVIGQYFHEIGAKLGMTKKPGEGRMQVAKLSLPLKFPQMSRGAPKRR